ncbi:MAG: hypothetical protein LIP23_00385, partial [Planctomycetes bacterium]|nr:hypothetical protein [Planctomycetota bacterium]
VNTSANVALYVKATNTGNGDKPNILIDIYTVPIDRAKPSDLVATGTYTQSGAGGTVVLDEANSSGLSGTVGCVLPINVGSANVNLQVEFNDDLRATVHVPAFVEETNANGTSKDVFNIASGWSIRGLDKPPAEGFDVNHPASTDLDGNVSVNYRYIDDPADPNYNKLMVEVSRPSFGSTAATVIATGFIDMGSAYDSANPPSTSTVSGRVELVGAPGFESITGSVYLEIPKGTEFTNAPTGTGVNDPTTVTYTLPSDAMAGQVVLGGATEIQGNPQAIADEPMQLKGDTLFKKGQVFTQDVRLPDGGVIAAGTPLDRDMTIPRGVVVQTDNLMQGTVLAAGQQVNFSSGIAEGTVIPRGSYYADGVGSFPGEGMGMSVTTIDPATGNPTTTSGQGVTGYDVKATFATVEDLMREVREAGVYVNAQISDDGTGIEFISTLAGAWLTVSEDFDNYEQMGDKYQQISNLDLTGMVKDVNTDHYGNVYTEVVYYPPDPANPGAKVTLRSTSGELVEVEPGYYVRVYTDPDAMKVPFADRDNSTLVAEGFAPAGTWNPDWDPDQPYDENSVPPNVPFLGNDATQAPGILQNMILEPRNDSGLSGTVNLDYYGDRGQVAVNATGIMENPDDYNSWGNDNITVFPGGLRVEGSRHAVIQQVDMDSVVPGKNCDYTGTFHGTITGDSASNSGVSIKMYRDPSNTVMTSRNDPDYVEPVPGRITLFEVDKYGNIVLDSATNEPIVSGYMNVSDVTLGEGQTDSFKITTGGTRNSGQDRADNVFATINDIIDGLNANDGEALHQLKGAAQADIDRLLEARASAGSRNKNLQTLRTRHNNDITSYTAEFTARVGMDSSALSMAITNYMAASNAYTAAMQVSGQMMQMSLLNYI